MHFIALALFLLQLSSFVNSECPEGYDEICEKCLMVEISDEPISWDDAKTACCGTGGTLASIDSEELLEELKDMGCMNESLWVGGYRRGAGFAWLLDGEGFNEWAHCNTERTECTHSNCAKLDSTGLIAEKCNEKLNGYICEAVNEDETTANPDDGEQCADEWEYLEETQNCYKAFNQSISYAGDADCSTWTLAQLTCVKEGGNLVSVGSDEEKEFIQCLVDGVPAWVGLSETENCMMWSDGSNSTTNVLPFANEDKALPACGLLLTKDNASSVVPDGCEFHYDQFVCSKPLCEDKEEQCCSCFGCPEGWIEDCETQNCYKILCEDPTCYEDSRINCATEGAFVTSILDENDHKFVTELLATFEEEQAYIGMILESAENPIKKWEDGTLVDFNKLEANVTGMCVVIDQTGKYLPVACTEAKSVVCRKPREPVACDEEETTTATTTKAPTTTAPTCSEDSVELLKVADGPKTKGIKPTSELLANRNLKVNCKGADKKRVQLYINGADDGVELDGTSEQTLLLKCSGIEWKYNEEVVTRVECIQY